MDTPLDLLAFSPHPDDAELSCGGSLILAQAIGNRTDLWPILGELSQLEIAAAGGHNMLMSGPPGSGKTFRMNPSVKLRPTPPQQVLDGLPGFA
jgi:type IV secretory pathway ATPase VirB11/archaellum biosynthesis ATPase